MKIEIKACHTANRHHRQCNHFINYNVVFGSRIGTHANIRLVHIARGSS